jgi:hypothetical protein
MPSIRAYRFQLRIRPSVEAQLRRFAGMGRWVWCRALAEQRARHARGEKYAGHAEMCKWLTAWRNDPATAWLADGLIHPQQQVLRRLDEAYRRFFSKAGGFPSFKRRGEEPGIRFPDPQRLSSTETVASTTTTACRWPPSTSWAAATSRSGRLPSRRPFKSVRSSPSTSSARSQLTAAIPTTRRTAEGRHPVTKSAHCHDVEGWDLFEFGLNTNLFEIQADADVEPAIFASDADAVAYVERKAGEGVWRHQEALDAHRGDAPAIAKLRERELSRDAPRRG